jgi:hypothetical protein
MTNKDKRPWPLVAPRGEYSDLHWLRGWGERIKALAESDKQPCRLSWMLFRPDEHARNALLRFATRYAEVIAQIREFLTDTEERFAELTTLLPPSACPECGNGGYLEVRDGALCCAWCGYRLDWCPPHPDLVDSATARFIDRCLSLCGVIRVAAEAIEAAETPATPKLAPPKPRTDEPTPQEIEGARILCQRMPKASKKQFMNYCGVGNSKALKLMAMMRSEELLQTKARTPKTRT